MSSFKNCTSVHLPECPLQGTIYGYYPSLSANSIFLALFVLSAVIFFVQGLIKRKTKMTFFWGVMFIGSLFEGIGMDSIISLIFCCVHNIQLLILISTGYIGRIMLHHNPYGSTGFQLQIVLLIICPVSISKKFRILWLTIDILSGILCSRNLRLSCENVTPPRQLSYQKKKEHLLTILLITELTFMELVTLASSQQT